MESKTILFTVDGDNISPRTEQKAGGQGNHNITEVRFEGDSVLSDAMENSENYKVRMQFIDGAGGFYSTGFLDVMSEIMPDESAQYYVTCPIPNNVTNAGGLAYVYLVVTEIVYEDGKALENQVYISPPGKLLYTHSGVGSPSEYAYKVGITNALVNAEIFVGRAERASESAKGYQEEASSYAGIAVESAKNAASDLQELKDGIASGNFKGEPGPQGPQGPQGVQGEKGEKGETPSLDGVIQYWQPNTEYKVGDVVIENFDNGYMGNPRTGVLRCVKNHTSSDYFSQDYLGDLKWEQKTDVWAEHGYRDYLGNLIPEHYATKDELAEAIGQALEGDY